MAKKIYTQDQLLIIMQACVDCAEGRIDNETAENRVRSITPHYFTQKNRLVEEIKKVKKYLAGKGLYGRQYPANWAEAFLEVTQYSPLVIKALREQQRLHLEKAGVNNKTLEKLLQNL